LKFAKRKLRIHRCKTITAGSSASIPRITTGTVKLPTTLVLPKGDPTLGEKLVHLTKEDRKKYKSADADRVARRLAKKRARMALEKGGLQPRMKDRERIRKSSAMKKNAMFAPKEIKRRVRSDTSMAKQNTKK
jgi:nucleolar protein 12